MNEKKTADEILDKISHTYHPEFNARYVRQEAAITSMHRFATQETAALREENERLKEALKDMVSIAEQHYPEELERQYEPRIENAKKLIKADSLKQNRQ